MRCPPKIALLQASMIVLDGELRIVESDDPIMQLLHPLINEYGEDSTRFVAPQATDVSEPLVIVLLAPPTITEQ